MINPPNPKRFFAAYVEEAINIRLGMCHPSVTTYLTDLLASNLHISKVELTRKFEQVISELKARQRSEELLQRALHRSMADKALFWLGVYPERLAEVGRRDMLRMQGVRSYEVVWRLSRPDDEPSKDVFQTLHRQFDECAHGLRLAREGWEADAEV